MVREGAAAYRDKVVEATERKQMTKLDPVRGLLAEWLPPCVDGLREWIAAYSKPNVRGPRPLALEYIKAMDPALASIIALRAILDGITVNRPAATALFIAVGQTVEHEQKVSEWEAKEPALWYDQQKRFASSKATETHQRRVNINRFNDLLRQGLFGFDWTDWSQEVHFRVGKELVDNVVRVTQWFDYIPDPDYVEKKGGRKGSGPRLTLTPKPKLVEWIGQALNKGEVSSPAFKPTLIPPKRWTGMRGGGYHTPYVNTPPLIRFKAMQRDQRQAAFAEFDRAEMPEVYAALHFVQETPWVVNRRVLDVVKEVLSKDLGIGGLPILAPRELPVKQANHNDADGVALKAWKREAAGVYSDNAKMLSRSRSAKRTFAIAQEYAEFDRFYFPHMFDFRGRMYPIPVGLNPQGDDLARGLLKFEQGKPVTFENQGAAWLAIQVATMWGGGADKLGFEDRIDWVEAREDLWRKIASDPVGNLEWSTSDEPWQALAAIFEWVAFLDTGMGFVSNLPIVVDGTCNGIQHLSAMVLDAEAGAHVNLTPSDKPRDIYKYVADALQAVLERIEQAGGEQGLLSTYWLELCGRNIPRAFTKRQVMVLPYGGTKDSFFTYTRKWLDEKAPMDRNASDEERKLRVARLSFVVGHLWTVVNEKVSGAMVVMKWLKECAKIVSEGNQPIVWKPPTEFVVRHFYGKQEAKEMILKLDGHTVKLNMLVATEGLDRHAQLLGISPNFVHSQDAACLSASINRARREGVITAFTAVHDAYGTHASDMKLLAVHLREAFIELHSGDALKGFRDICINMLADQLELSNGISAEEAEAMAAARMPAVPPKGNLDLNDIRHADYFFA